MKFITILNKQNIAVILLLLISLNHFTYSTSVTSKHSRSKFNKRVKKGDSHNHHHHHEDRLDSNAIRYDIASFPYEVLSGFLKAIPIFGTAIKLKGKKEQKMNHRSTEDWLKEKCPDTGLYYYNKILSRESTDTTARAEQYEGSIQSNDNVCDKKFIENIKKYKARVIYPAYKSSMEKLSIEQYFEIKNTKLIKDFIEYQEQEIVLGALSSGDRYRFYELTTFNSHNDGTTVYPNIKYFLVKSRNDNKFYFYSNKKITGDLYGSLGEELKHIDQTLRECGESEEDIDKVISDYADDIIISGARHVSKLAHKIYDRKTQSSEVYTFIKTGVKKHFKALVMIGINTFYLLKASMNCYKQVSFKGKLKSLIWAIMSAAPLIFVQHMLTALTGGIYNILKFVFKIAVFVHKLHKFVKMSSSEYSQEENPERMTILGSASGTLLSIVLTFIELLIPHGDHGEHGGDHGGSHDVSTGGNGHHKRLRKIRRK